MLFAVMQHMAALAKGFEIAHPVVAGIMIEMGGTTLVFRIVSSSGAGGRAAKHESALPLPLRHVAASSSHHRPSPEVKYQTAVRTTTFVRCAPRWIYGRSRHAYSG
jgi:hypothetical protein